jgi:TPR repeat protein
MSRRRNPPRKPSTRTRELLDIVRPDGLRMVTVLLVLPAISLVSACEAKPEPLVADAARSAATAVAAPSPSAVASQPTAQLQGRPSKTRFRLACGGGAAAQDCGCAGRADCVEVGASLIALGAAPPPSLAAMARRGCDSGELEQCETLAILYLNGKGVPKDVSKAVMMFEQACQRRDMASCDDLGALYATGTGRPADLTHARQLFDKVCSGGEEQGCDDAKLLVGLTK